MLLERDDELRALEAVLDTGGVLVVEGGVGIGKTSLLRHGAERARRRGWRLLRGVGSELETGFAFGVVRQLFERELAAADPGQRAEWLAGPAGAVRGLLEGPGAAVPDDAAVFGSAAGLGYGAPEPFAVVHGLYWLTVNMTAGQPVLITVDDAHWADPASLRWLAESVAVTDSVSTSPTFSGKEARSNSNVSSCRLQSPRIGSGTCTGWSALTCARTASERMP